MTGPIKARTYHGENAFETWRDFEADAAEAVRFGYVPTSQSWDGSTLTVIYQQRDDGLASPPSHAGSETRTGRRWVGTVVPLAVGLLYGYAVSHLADAPSYDCGAQNAVLSGILTFVVGVLAALLVVPAVAAIITRRVLGAAGCAWMTLVVWMGSCVGFVLHQALWPQPVLRPC